MNVGNVYMTALDATKAFDNSNVAVMAYIMRIRYMQVLYSVDVNDWLM